MSKFIHCEARGGNPNWVIPSDCIHWIRSNNDGVEIMLKDGQRVLTDTFDVDGILDALVLTTREMREKSQSH